MTHILDVEKAKDTILPRGYKQKEFDKYVTRDVSHLEARGSVCIDNIKSLEQMRQ